MCPGTGLLCPFRDCSLHEGREIKQILQTSELMSLQI